MPLPPLDILFEDNHCLAVCKPAGRLTTALRGRRGDARPRWSKPTSRRSTNKPGNVFLGVVHRLDKPVSGVLLFARTSKAAARLSEQFRESTVTKVYWAVVTGRVEPESGTWENWLWKDPLQGVVQTVKFGTPDAKLARLTYTRRSLFQTHSWVEVHPRTGRTHQIRVQLASRGYPIVGDRKYGSKEAFDEGIARSRPVADLPAPHQL